MEPQPQSAPAAIDPEAPKITAEVFGSGLHCAESVLMALARAQGIESDILPKVATAFGGGFSRTCGPCGALTGAAMGIGLALGRKEPAESVDTPYAATQQLIREFEQAFGSRHCHELLGCDLGTEEGLATFKEKQLRERCSQFTGKATEIAVRLIAQAKAAPPSTT